MNEQELLKLKQPIESKKEEKLKLEGQLEEKMSRLKEDFDCSSVEETEEYVNDLRKDIEQLTKQIEDEAKSIQEELGEV